MKMLKKMRGKCAGYHNSVYSISNKLFSFDEIINLKVESDKPHLRTTIGKLCFTSKQNHSFFQLFDYKGVRKRVKQFHLVLIIKKLCFNTKERD